MRVSLIVLPVLVLCMAATMPVPDTLEKIGMAIQTGNARELAKYFDTNVEITINEEEEVYSRAQAEVVLKDFFNKQQPSSFKIIHQGNSNKGSQYGIGTLITSKGNFRTYIYIKQKGSAYYIQEIRFEND